MPHLCRLLLPPLLMLLPAVALGMPIRANSEVPPLLRVVTPRGSGVDSTATYTVILRDAINVPYWGGDVWLDFTDCDHVMLAEEQPFYPPVQKGCAPPFVGLGGLSDENGAVSFIVLGSVLQRWPDVADAGCIRVTVMGMDFGNVSPAAYDQDGVGGLTANDLSLVTCDRAAWPSPIYARSDFNGDGFIDGYDVANWMGQYFDARGASRTPARCDLGSTGLPATVLPGSRLRLAWGDCAAGDGQQTATFTCNTNAGVHRLEASFVAPPGVEAMTGFEAELFVTGPAGAPLPQWWGFEPGGCRLPLGLNLQTIASCPPVGDGTRSVAGLRMEYIGSPAVGLIRIIGTVGTTSGGSDLAVPLTPGEEYSLFELPIPHNRTVGTGSCPDCAVPVAIQFRSLKLTQIPPGELPCVWPPAPGAPAVADLLLVRDPTTTEAFAFWQGPPEGWEALDAPKAANAPDGLRLWATNPSRGATRVELGLPRAMPCRLALFDIAGRRRRVLLDETVPAGTRALTWDGRDDAGQALVSGYYVLRLMTEEGTISRSLVRLR